MSEVKTIIFIGRDEKFWSSLQTEFKKAFPTEKFKFEQLYKKDDKLFQSLIVDITNLNPHILFIDYTTEPGKLMTLARLIRRCFPHMKAIIGLWDYLSDTKFIKESNITGVYINHIKTGEFEDIIYHARLLSEKESTDLPSVANAQIPIEYPLQMGSLMKIGYITPTRIHLESNFNFGKGQALKLKTHMNKNFNLEYFKVESSDNKDLYYSFNYWQNYIIEFRDESSGEIDSETNEPIVKMKGSLIQSKYLEWFNQNKKESSSFRERVLIIDDSLATLEQAQKPLDAYPNSIRFNNAIDEEGKIIRQVYPRFIVYHYRELEVIEPEEGEEGEEVAQEAPSADSSEEDEDAPREIYGEEALQIIMSQIKSLQGYTPFILVFNAKESSDSLRQKLGYEKIIADTESFNFDKVINLCDALNAKMKMMAEQPSPSEGQESSENEAAAEVQEEQETSDGEESEASNLPPIDSEPRIFLDKNSEESNVEFIISAQLNEVSESYILFTCDMKIPMNTVFELNLPVQMYITVIPRGEEGATPVEGGFQYLGVNHGITEAERAKLRRFVNEMIYLPKKLEKEAEKAEFEAKKQEFKDKEAAAKKAAEEEAQRKAEEEAKKKEEEEKAKLAAQQQAENSDQDNQEEA